MPQDRPDIQNYEDDLRSLSPVFAPADTPGVSLDNVAFHDFAFYEYLAPPQLGFRPGLSNAALAIVDTWERQSGPDLAAVVAEVLLAIENGIRDGVSHRQHGDWDDQALIDILIASFYSAAAFELPAIIQAAINERSRGTLFAFLEDFLRGSVHLHICSRLSLGYHASAVWADWNFAGEYGIWFRGIHGPAPGAGTAPPISYGDVAAQQTFEKCREDSGYRFEVFPERSTNLGLRLVYRQEWRPLGKQPGEIVRTIPLGPGQKQKISFKIVDRRKTTFSSETGEERETTTETAANTKDSSELVREAADTFKWNVDAKVGASFFVTAEVSTSVGGSSEDKSRQTSSHLSEAMKKTAARTRNTSKVLVNTETEATIEQETVSEISNPNNEIAVTYEFLKLQQQYEVFTYLAEVQSVIFVAESVPAPAGVTDEWIRANDWILARVLRDESHRQTLNELIQDTDEKPQVSGAGLNPLAFGATQAINRFASFSSVGPNGPGGLSVPDIYAEPQRIYKEYLREEASRLRANEIRSIRRERFRQHLRDNILYYCRAIWDYEDPDQRMLRYMKEGRRIPAEWRGPLLQAAGAPVEYAPTSNTVPLWQVIDPTGPIGYVGNYAVFGVRPPPEDPEANLSSLGQAIATGEVRLSLNDLMEQMRSRYVRNGRVLDPALTGFRREAAARTVAELRAVDNDQVRDFVSYRPRLRGQLIDAQQNVIRDSNGDLQYQITPEQWAQYLYRKNGTRRFLVDSNNVYLRLAAGEGAALEPFKRLHRYLDALTAYQGVVAAASKNRRRDQLLNEPRMFDPDIDKVVVVGDGAGSLAAAHAALHEAMERNPLPAPVPASGDAQPDSV